MTQGAAVDIDMSSIEFRNNPYPQLADLRAVDPVHRQANGFWMITRHADVAAATRDPRLVRDTRSPDQITGPRPSDPLAATVEQWMLSLDGADHSRLRRVVSRAFTPRAVAALTTEIESICDDLLDKTGSGSIDFITEFAQPFPVRVICRLLGLPADEFSRIQHLSTAIGAAAVEPQPSLTTWFRGTRAVTELRELLTGWCEINDPRDGTVVASLIEAVDAEHITGSEFVANLILLFFAGHETTTNLLGNGMLALLRDPDQLCLLRGEPDLVGTAVEELLRFDGPANVNGRMAREPLQIGGATHRRRRVRLSDGRCCKPRSERLRQPRQARPSPKPQPARGIRRRRALLHRRPACEAGSEHRAAPPTRTLVGHRTRRIPCSVATNGQHPRTRAATRHCRLTSRTSGRHEVDVGRSDWRC